MPSTVNDLQNQSCPHKLHLVGYSLISSVVKMIIYFVSFTRLSMKFWSSFHFVSNAKAGVMAKQNVAILLLRHE